MTSDRQDPQQGPQQDPQQDPQHGGSGQEPAQPTPEHAPGWSDRTQPIPGQMPPGPPPETPPAEGGATVQGWQGPASGYGRPQGGPGQVPEHQDAQFGAVPYGTPPYGQDAFGQDSYGQHPYGQEPNGAGPYGGGQYPPGPGPSPAAAQGARGRRSIGVGGFVAGVVIAGLLGGGIGAGVTGVLADGGDAPSSSSGIEINNPENASAVTAAASKASPSVVTLGVSDGANSGSGSGIVLDDEGHVLTNTHVVTLGGASADPTVEARMSDGSVTSAEVVGTDPLSDLAVVQLDDTDGIEPAELGSSGDLNVGDPAVAIGAPLGLSGTVTDGIVSTLDRTISVASSAVEEEPGDQPSDAPNDPPEGDGGPGDEDSDGFEFFFPDMEGSSAQGEIYINVIQTDAAINRGNSGGALVDDEGKVIGVNVAIASAGGMTQSEGGSIGVGFAIPIDYAKRVADDIIDDGEVSHGLLGVTVAAAGLEGGPSGQQDQQGQSFTTGALVDEVADGSPAADAGFERGDVITSVDGRPVEDSVSLTAVVREYAAGDTISVTYQRDGNEDTADVTLEGM